MPTPATLSINYHFCRLSEWSLALQEQESVKSCLEGITGFTLDHVDPATTTHCRRSSHWSRLYFIHIKLGSWVGKKNVCCRFVHMLRPYTAVSLHTDNDTKYLDFVLLKKAVLRNMPILHFCGHRYSWAWGCHF